MEAKNAFNVTDADRARGYDVAEGFARAGTEVVAGVATGGAAGALANGGRLAKGVSYGVRAFDAAGNVVNAAEGAVGAAKDLRETGSVSWQNGLKMAGGALGTAGDFADLAKVSKARKSANAVADAAGEGTLPTRGAADGAGDAATANGAFRSGPGDRYANQVLEGGSGDALAGHGEFRPGSGSVTVPDGTSITLPREGVRILDRTAGYMERGDWDGLLQAAKNDPRVADDLVGMAAHLPGAQIPNYTLKAPTGLNVHQQSLTVEDATQLVDLLKSNEGNRVWAACTNLRR